MGVTRERVRQVLVKGTKYGLFNYRGHEYVYISKEDLLSALEKDPVPGRAAKILGASSTYLRRLLISYGITAQKLEEFRLNKRKKKAVDEYRTIKEQLGHHPTTTELQYNKKWRPLSARIYKLWGSTDRFREEFDIPKPPQGNPRFRDDTRAWREQHSQIALIKRMQRLDDIRDFLSSCLSANAQKISDQCNIKYNQVGRYLNVLIAAGEVIREGAGSQTKYCLANGEQKNENADQN
jgi:predicted transcriptional regulator